MLNHSQCCPPCRSGEAISPVCPLTVLTERHLTVPQGGGPANLFYVLLCWKTLLGLPPCTTMVIQRDWTCSFFTTCTYIRHYSVHQQHIRSSVQLCCYRTSRRRMRGAVCSAIHSLRARKVRNLHKCGLFHENVCRTNSLIQQQRQLRAVGRCPCPALMASQCRQQPPTHLATAQ